MFKIIFVKSFLDLDGSIQEQGGYRGDVPLSSPEPEAGEHDRPGPNSYPPSAVLLLFRIRLLFGHRQQNLALIVAGADFLRNPVHRHGQTVTAGGCKGGPGLQSQTVQV